MRVGFAIAYAAAGTASSAIRRAPRARTLTRADDVSDIGNSLFSPWAAGKLTGPGGRCLATAARSFPVARHANVTGCRNRVGVVRRTLAV